MRIPVDTASLMHKVPFIKGIFSPTLEKDVKLILDINLRV